MNMMLLGMMRTWALILTSIWTSMDICKANYLRVLEVL